MIITTNSEMLLYVYNHSQTSLPKEVAEIIIQTMGRCLVEW